MWYLIDANPDSKIISGFNSEYNKVSYNKALEDGRIAEILEAHPAKNGDVYFIPAGTVHAIGAGVLLAEIQQTSDVTYRIYDYDRKDAEGNFRELHNDLAADAINFKDNSTPLKYSRNVQNEPVKLVTCQYFTTNLLNLNQERNNFV